jgi:hypothetical protein
MAAASVIAAIGFGATVFMLWVLIALLRDGVRWSRYQVARVARYPQPRKEVLQILSVTSDGTHLRQVGSNRSDDRVELLENQNHEKGEYGSGLCALGVCTMSGKFGWRAVYPKYSVRRERGF